MSDFSPTIGSIDGIKIELHWSFLLLLLVILFVSLYAFVLVVLLFICVLVHELVHCITSRRNGIKVKKIVLYPLGGGSIIDMSDIKPDVEFRISIVGPIASLLLGVVVGIIDIYTPAGMVRVAMQALFILNILLGLFNLLPWLPLDGGRALRSYLQRKRSFLDATRLAVKCSNIVTVLFVVGTIIYAALIPGYSFAYREFIVLIDMIVAFFIYGGAQAELQGAIVKDNISDLRTKDVMVKNYVMLKGDAKVSDLYKTLMAKRSSIVLFMKGDRVMMVFHTALQKLLKNPTPEGSIENLGVEIPVVKANSALYNAIDKMRLDESGVAAVTNGKKIVGVLLSQHIESVVALHMSQRRNAKDAQQRK